MSWMREGDLMLDYKDYVYAVYLHKSFSKAARELNVTQPWLSTAVKKTEQELEISLFDRSTTPVTLTDAGKYYIEQIQRIYAIEGEMKHHFAQMKAQPVEKIRIGSSMYFCTYVLPELAREFCELYPKTKVFFTEGQTVQLTEKLRAGELDLILEAEQVEHKQIATVPWEIEEILLAVPADNPINQTLEEYYYTFEELLGRKETGLLKPCVPLEHFSGEPFLLLSEEQDMHRRGLQICRNAGFEPDVRVVLAQLMTAYYLVSEGQGVTFIRSGIPEHVVPTRSIVFYRLSDPLAIRSIYLSYLKENTSEIQKRLIQYMESKQG